MGHILFVKPVFKEMLWGGERLKTEFGYDIPSSNTGECWAISAHKNGNCTILEGEYEGSSLNDLYQNHRELFGNIQDEQFPLLIKLIDANNDLSLQVHPDDKYAREVEHSLGKTECWYVLDTKEYTKLVLGHKAKSKQEFIDAMAQDKLIELVHLQEIHKDECFYIPSGTIHAICEGALIYEAQQSSDITYRFFDYNRVDKNGNKRELHIKKALDVVNVPYNNDVYQDRVVTKINDTTISQLISCPYLNLFKYDIEGHFDLENNKPFLLVSCIEGQGKIENREIKKGDHFIICSDQPHSLIEGSCCLMVCSL